MNYLKPFYPQWDAERAQELLRQFELPRDRKIRNLSHGMRMKAALASSLAYRPRLIVLDEPFTGLDALVRDELIEGVLGCADGATILIVGSGNCGGPIPEILARSAVAGKSSSKFR